MSNPIVTLLSRLLHVHAIRPAIMRAGNAVLRGAEYEETLATPEGSEAYRKGEREYLRRMFYASGPIPAVLRHRRADALSIPDGRVLWIAFHMQTPERLRPEAFQYHPLDVRGRPLPSVGFSWDPHPGRTDGRPLLLSRAEFHYL